MDILRKELNAIYEAQRLHEETLETSHLDKAKDTAYTIASASGGCSVVTDASCDRCYIYADSLGRLISLTDFNTLFREENSSDEDEIYNRIHPEDLVEKRMLEFEFFKTVHALPVEDKLFHKATCRLRMRDRQGGYIMIDNTTQVIGLSPAGKIWLILCCYFLSPSQVYQGDITPHIIDTQTGDVTELYFRERRKQVLTFREKEILKMIKEGMLSKQIADCLNISVHTVSRHRQNIIEKLCVSNSTEAVSAAIAMNLL